MPLPPLATMRWLCALSTAAVCGGLIALIAGRAPASNELVLTFSFMGVALAAYAWGLYATAGAMIASGAIFLCLLWAWAALHQGELGLVVAALGLLLVVAIIQRRRRFKRWLRLSQVVDDLVEERTVKDQAIRLAQKTRDNLQKKLGRYQQLQAIAERLSNLVQLEAITQLAVDSAFELIGKSQVCLLFLIDPDQQMLSLRASRRAEPVASVPAKHGDQFDRHVLRTHKPLLVNDVRRDFRFTMAGSQGRAIGAVIGCPLLLNQSAEGVLRLDSDKPGTYTQDDLRFLDILLDLAATSIANARLFAKTQRLAMTDGLTGLWLRRPFLEQLERELVRAGRTHEPLAVLMLDLDNFKAYNDAYGHTAGDAVLLTVADALRQASPPDATVARLGGEEFAVLLPRAAREGAQRIAENLRGAVERVLRKTPRTERAGAAPVTVSIGVASFPDDAQADLELIRIADQRLYEAKRSGKNRVCA